MNDTNLKFYDQLLRLHLFQGVGRSDLAQIVGHSKIGFETISEGTIIANEGTGYDNMKFIINGTAKVIATAEDKQYAIEEYISAPYTIQPEKMFGLSQSFSRTFVADSRCNIITMSKEEILKLTDEILIFRLNLLNTYTTMIQKRENKLWQLQPAMLDDKIAKWIIDRCLTNIGPKTIKIKMKTLGEELNDSRLDISRALNRMQQKGIIELSRGKIFVPQAKML